MTSKTILHKIHHLQTALVRKLTTSPKGARFNELLLENLVSEHMNYHLKQLMRLGYIEKKGERYILTDTGKDYVNLTDDEVSELEKQPKTSVILWGVRENDQGQTELLVCRRLRHPYYGKVGRLTGKVRYGERLEEAAVRELYEETGLTAKKLTLQRIYHKVRSRADGNTVQDVIFYIFLLEEMSGTFITKTAHQENFWITEADFTQKKYDFFDDFELVYQFGTKAHNKGQINDLILDEHVGIADGF